MHRPLLLVLTTLVACGPKADTADTAEVTSTAPTETSPGTTDTDPGTDPADAVEILAVDVQDNPYSTLSAIVVVETSADAEVEVAFTEVGSGAWATSHRGAWGTVHEIEVVGIHELTDVELEVTAWGEDGTAVTADGYTYTTGEAPVFEDLQVVVSDAGAMSPGFTLFGAVGVDGGPPPPPPDGTPAGPPPDDAGATPYLVGVDPAGELVWYLEYTDGQTFNDRDVRVLSDGNFMISSPGGFVIVTPGGRIVREITDASTGYTLHHDAVQASDGHILSLVKEARTIDVPSQGGMTSVTGDGLVDIDENGDVVWTWWTFDHLDTNRYPDELSSMSSGGGLDWTHANGLHYDPTDDTVVVSLRSQSQVIKVSRATGEIVWTFGEDGDFALIAGEWPKAQHAPELHSDGTLLVYDNGNGKSPEVSRAAMFELDTGAWTAKEVWQHDTQFFTDFLGDADLLDNGNILICAGGQNTDGWPAQLYEVAPDGAVVWQGDLANRIVYRTTRVASF